MALNVSGLSSQLFAAFSKAQSATTPDAQNTLANDIAQAIDVFVKSATVTTQVTGLASGGVCKPLGPVSGATVTGTGIGSPGTGLS